jgi:hypothetical protein
MVRFEVSCELPFDAADFWRLRASAAFLRHIVDDGMLARMSATPPVDAGGGWSSRELSYVPANVECPAIVRAVVGDTAFGVTDCQRWQDGVVGERGARVQEFNIRPDFLTGLSRTFGTLIVCDVEADDHEMVEEEEAVDVPEAEQAADAAEAGKEGSETASADGSAVSTEGSARRVRKRARCLHVVRGETRVSVPTVGWFVERAIAHNLRVFYRDYPGSVARFRDAIVERYAGGDDSVPIEVVVDRLLEAEAREAAEAAAAAEAATNEREAGAGEAADVAGDGPEVEDSNVEGGYSDEDMVAGMAADGAVVEKKDAGAGRKSLDEAAEAVTLYPSETRLSDIFED